MPRHLSVALASSLILAGSLLLTACTPPAEVGPPAPPTASGAPTTSATPYVVQTEVPSIVTATLNELPFAPESVIADVTGTYTATAPVADFEALQAWVLGREARGWLITNRSELPEAYSVVAAAPTGAIVYIDAAKGATPYSTLVYAASKAEMAAYGLIFTEDPFPSAPPLDEDPVEEEPPVDEEAPAESSGE